MENLKIKEWLDPNDNYKYQKCSLVATGSGFIGIPDGAELLTASGKELVFWKNDGQYSFHTVNSIGWDKAENGLCDLSDYMDSSVKIVWQREQIQQEQGLISGADAKLAWAKGEDVQISHKHATLKKEWHDLYGTLMLSAFDSDMYEFRLKPRTITLNVEIPAPFEPKEGEEFFILAPLSVTGYTKVQGITTQVLLDEYVKLGAWRTEEEIKQVVAALRGWIKG